ncbi:MAG: bL17 family ribosomal protein [Planctomycetota bacterium]|jgi:large subunit ribosomal protein L17|nr:50S ribosomal protein L17 [Blastopirellula sp.]
MRHRRIGRRLGRSSPHRKALMKNLACALFLTEREDEFYEGLFQADGKTAVKPPQFKGRIVTTLQKAKEARPQIERCITIAKRALPHLKAAEQFATSADRNSEEWRAWRKSDKWNKWANAMAPVVNARRRLFAILRDNEAVRIVFDEIAPRMEDRNGGYTRVLRLARPRLGDAGTRAILELVGRYDRRQTEASQKPAFESDE